MICCEQQTKTAYIRTCHTERRDKRKLRGWQPIGQVCMNCGEFYRMKKLKLVQGMTARGSVSKDEKKRV